MDKDKFEKASSLMERIDIINSRLSDLGSVEEDFSYGLALNFISPEPLKSKVFKVVVEREIQAEIMEITKQYLESYLIVLEQEFSEL